MKKLSYNVAYAEGWLKKINLVTVSPTGLMKFKPEDRIIPSLSMLDVVLSDCDAKDVRIFGVAKSVSAPKEVLMSLIKAVKADDYQEYCDSLKGSPYVSQKVWESFAPTDGAFVPLVEGSVNHSTLIIFARGVFLERLVGARQGTPEFYDRVQKWKRFGSPAMTPANGVCTISQKLRVGVIPEDDEKAVILASKGIDAQAADGDIFYNGTRMSIQIKKYGSEDYEPLETAQFRYRESSEDLVIYEVWKGVMRDCPQWIFADKCHRHGFNHKDIDILTSEGNIKASNLKGKRIQVIDTKHLGLLNVNDSGPCSLSRQPITATCFRPEYQRPMYDLYEYLRQQGVSYDLYNGMPKIKRSATKMFFDVIKGDLVATANLMNMKQATGFEDIVSTMIRLTLFPVRGNDGEWRVPAYKTARGVLAPKLIGAIRGDILSVQQDKPGFGKLSSLYSEYLDELRFSEAAKGNHVVPVVLTHEQGKAYVKFYSKHDKARNALITYPVAGVPNITGIKPVCVGKDGKLEIWSPGKRMLTDSFIGLPVSAMYSMIKDCDGDTAYLYLFISEYEMPVAKVYKIVKATKDDKPECSTNKELYALLLVAEAAADTGIGLADSAIATCATAAIAAGNHLPYGQIVKLQEILELVIKAEQRGKVSGKTIPEFVNDIYSIGGFGKMPYKNALLNVCFGSFGLKRDDEDGNSFMMVKSWLSQCHAAVPLCNKIEARGEIFPYSKLVREVSSTGVKEMRLVETDASWTCKRFKAVLDHFTKGSDPYFKPGLVRRCKEFAEGSTGVNSRYTLGVMAQLRAAGMIRSEATDGISASVPVQATISAVEKSANISALIAGHKDEVASFAWKIVMRDAPLDQEPTDEENAKIAKVLCCLALCVGIDGFTKSSSGRERPGGAFFTLFEPVTYLWIARYYWKDNPVLKSVTESIV